MVDMSSEPERKAGRLLTTANWKQFQQALEQLVADYLSQTLHITMGKVLGDSYVTNLMTTHLGNQIDLDLTVAIALYIHYLKLNKLADDFIKGRK